MQEYTDVFPKEVPPGLPPIRGIEHQIDLIPRASLPNRAPYRTNLEETKEIQCQVQELLNKGYVRESLSPCVVPVHLVPKKNGSWHMCVDCRAINNTIIRYHHPISRLYDCWYFLTLTEKSASAQKYRGSTSPGSIQGIVFSTRNGGVTVFKLVHPGEQEVG